MTAPGYAPRGAPSPRAGAAPGEAARVPAPAVLRHRILQHEGRSIDTPRQALDGSHHGLALQHVDPRRHRLLEAVDRVPHFVGEIAVGETYRLPGRASEPALL